MVSWVPGMRWVCYVRVVHSVRGPRFYGVGVGHRHPRTIALSAAGAARLAGVVPFVETVASGSSGAKDTGDDRAQRSLTRVRR